MQTQEWQWAVETFGQARLGDARRVRRLIRLAAAAAIQPHGRISQVFSTDRDRQGAYDFVECGDIKATAIAEAVAGATARAVGDCPFVFAPVDGSSLKLWDGTGHKDFGRIGTHANGASGLNVMSSLFISPEGVPIGLSGQAFWARPRKRKKQPRHGNRALKDKETRHWMEVFEQAQACRDAYAPDTKIWYQLDRGGDAWTILHDLEARGDWFTIRSKANRRIGNTKRLLRTTIRRAPVRFHYQCEVRGRMDHKEHADRKERQACLGVRASSLTLELRNMTTGKRYSQKLNVVMVREVGTTPKGEKPLEWTLLTNHPIATQAQIEQVIYGYTLRWRIEEFHKTWKSGLCNVEETQLHSKEAVKRWATILAAVATRAEKLKHLSRETPNEPASVELTADEEQMLRLLRTKYGPTKERQPSELTVELAVRWIADLGGYVGKSSGGPPGSITIQRGLERLLMATEGMKVFKDRRK